MKNLIILTLLASCATVQGRVAVDAERNSKARCEAAATHDERVAIMVDVRRVRAAYDRLSKKPLTEEERKARDETDAACSAG